MKSNREKKGGNQDDMVYHITFTLINGNRVRCEGRLLVYIENPKSRVSRRTTIRKEVHMTDPILQFWCLNRSLNRDKTIPPLLWKLLFV